MFNIKSKKQKIFICTEITVKKGESYEILCTTEMEVKACTIKPPYHAAGYVMWVSGAM